MDDKQKKRPATDGFTVVTAVDRVAPSAKRAYILFLAGPLVGKLHMLGDGPSSIGRTEGNTIVINDNRISRRHVEITVQGEQAVLRDLGSTNGTYVNGARVTEHRLQDGDKIQVSSSTIFKFALQDDTENVYHKELYKMAVKDAVTNLYNKRHFLERFAEELSLARRRGTPLSLLMIDIDHFKQVNDTHGHLAGDMVLYQVARRLEAIIREEDLLARYGGEEFAVLLRGSTEAEGFALAERMRLALAGAPVPFEKITIPVTLSAGIATHHTDTPFDSIEALIQAADECLYYSKRHGRNRATKASELPPTASA